MVWIVLVLNMWLCYLYSPIYKTVLFSLCFIQYLFLSPSFLIYWLPTKYQELNLQSSMGEDGAYTYVIAVKVTGDISHKNDTNW